MEFVVAVVDDILNVIFDYKALSFQNFIEHYFKSIKLFESASILVEDAFADPGNGGLEYFDKARREAHDLSGLWVLYLGSSWLFSGKTCWKA